MHKRSFSSASPSASASIGDVSLARLRAHGRQTKASTVKMLLDLQASGAWMVTITRHPYGPTEETERGHREALESRD